MSGPGSGASPDLGGSGPVDPEMERFEREQKLMELRLKALRKLTRTRHLEQKDAQAKIEAQKTANVKLLCDLAELAENQNVVDKARDKKKKAAGAAGSVLTAIVTTVSMSCSGGGSSSGTLFPLILKPFIDVFQLMGQLSDALNFPPSWKTAFAGLALTLNCGFLQAYDIPFESIFYPCVTITFLCFFVLCLIQCVTGSQGDKTQVLEKLRQIYNERKKCLDADKPYKEKGVAKERIIGAVGIILSLLYMPVTTQSLQVVFCHRSIQCQYDCYNEQAHKNLVAIGIIVLAVITLGTPIFYTVVTRRVIVKYQYFIATFDQDLQNEHWEKFHQLYRTPFNSIYEKYTFPHCYFEIVTIMFKTVMCFLSMSMTPETLAQLVSVIALQGAFVILVAASKPFSKSIGNYVLLAVHTLFLSILCCQCLGLLFPEERAIDYIMITITVGIIIFIIGAIRKYLKEEGGESESTEEEADGEAEAKNSENLESEEMLSRELSRSKDAGEGIDTEAVDGSAGSAVGAKEAADLPSDESQGPQQLAGGAAVAIPSESQRALVRRSPAIGSRSQNVGREPWLGLIPPSDGPSSTMNQNNAQLEDAEEF